MYIKRGDYTHSNNEATFSVRKEAEYADNNVLIGSSWKIKVRGKMDGADAQALSTSMLSMEAAYAQTSGDFTVLDNSSATVPLFYVQGSKAIGGIRMTNFNYQLAEAAELSTYVRYEIDLEADFGGVGIIGGVNAPQNTILTWSETISMRGNGGPRVVYRENRNGPPQKQIVSQRTPVFALQRGEAVGLYNWPTPSQPKWPQYLSGPDSDVQQTSAQSVGGSGYQQQKREYRVTWSYSFLMPGPQQASPSLGY